MKNTVRAALMAAMILPIAAPATAQAAPVVAAGKVLGIFSPESFVLFLIASALLIDASQAQKPAKENPKPRRPWRWGW